MSTKVTVKSALTWMELVLAALESYLWAFKESLISPRQIFDGKLQNLFNDSSRNTQHKVAFPKFVIGICVL